jgi:hypothetical protein
METLPLPGNANSDGGYKLTKKIRIIPQKFCTQVVGLKCGKSS